MRFGRRLATAVVFLYSAIVLGTAALAGECDFCVCTSDDTDNSCKKCCSSAKLAEKTATKLELRLSADGKSLVDQNGEVLARFAEGTRVQLMSKGAKAINVKMQGCWHCYPVCVVYEGKKCVQWMRTCDWDFDC